MAYAEYLSQIDLLGGGLSLQALLHPSSLPTALGLPTRHLPNLHAERRSRNSFWAQREAAEMEVTYCPSTLHLRWQTSKYVRKERDDSQSWMSHPLSWPFHHDARVGRRLPLSLQKQKQKSAKYNNVKHFPSNKESSTSSRQLLPKMCILGREFDKQNF